MRNQRISETTRLQSSARALINRRALVFLAHALATLRALVLLAHALSGATPILVYASLCVTKRLRREYTRLGREQPGESIISLLTDNEDMVRRLYNNNDTQEYNITGVWYGYVFKKVTW